MPCSDSIFLFPMIKQHQQCPYTCCNNQTCLSDVSHSDLPVVCWLLLSALISQTPSHRDPTTEAKEPTTCTTQSLNYQSSTTFSKSNPRSIQYHLPTASSSMNFCSVCHFIELLQVMVHEFFRGVQNSYR